MEGVRRWLDASQNLKGRIGCISHRCVVLCYKPFSITLSTKDIHTHTHNRSHSLLNLLKVPWRNVCDAIRRPRDLHSGLGLAHDFAVFRNQKRHGRAVHLFDRRAGIEVLLYFPIRKPCCSDCVCIIGRVSHRRSRNVP